MDELSTTESALIIILVFALILIPFIFYLITLRNTLRAISPENRTMNPSQVWLIFIPIYGLIWHFVMVSRISDSIANESLTRDFELKESRPAYSIGIAMCVLNCGSVLSKVLGPIASFCGLAFIICWIIYWSKIAAYKKQIEASSEITLDAESNIHLN